MGNSKDLEKELEGMTGKEPTYRQKVQAFLLGPALLPPTPQPDTLATLAGQVNSAAPVSTRYLVVGPDIVTYNPYTGDWNILEVKDPQLKEAFIGALREKMELRGRRKRRGEPLTEEA
jgi:hypothetical protein